MRRRGRVGLALLLLLIAGFGFEAAAEQADARRFPPPGRLIAVGDHRLHLDCRGTGEFTVILESGSATPSPAWALVTQETAGFVRVCTYDRAGYGWSDATRTMRTAEAVTGELHTLLQNAGEHGPYLLVAHSLGGLYARAYAKRYPAEVAGLVLVDTRTEATMRLLASAGPGIEPPRALLRAAPVLVRSGLVRPLLSIIGVGAVAGTDSFERLPEEAQVEAAVGQAPSLGDLPLVVLSHGKPIYTEAQERAWQVEQPALVVQAIRAVMQVARERR